MMEAIARYPFVEVGIIVALIAFSIALWSASKIDPHEEDVQERTHGQGSVIAQLNGTITAATIILGAIGAFVALHSGFTDIQKQHLLWSSIFTLTSICLSVWTLGMLPFRALKYNVVKVKVAAIMAALSSMLFVAGSIRFMLAVWYVFSK